MATHGSPAQPSQESIGKDSIEDGLKRLGVAAGDILAVHSSLSSLGHVIGGADAVVAALMESVGENGALVMPVYPVSKPLSLTAEDVQRGLAWKVRVLHADLRGVRSGMGIVADRFRDRGDVVKGTDPYHPVAAWGRQADKLAQGYEHLLELDGRVLLIGVGFDRCSALHVAEGRVRLPEALLRRTEPPEDIYRLYPRDQWAVGFRGPFVSFSRVQAAAEELGLVESRRIGAATVRLCWARAIVDLFERLLRECPERLVEQG